ncbi:MAG: prepilin-type N-terminal cleavage/methylation domain-containing protein [Desulfobacterales bacterium]|nr:prepilin-type N-terminal cleavage/methylation domain-containing protein [Desulfobacterales bacterium]MDJ0913883.1 prepilin-type N-terminal cleavage/methylation domain-containing protein [Desulfobacterales bacterium]
MKKNQLTTEIRSSGFTLLEIMVAIAIIAIVLVSVYRMQSQTILMNMAAQFETLAPILAQDKMAEFETKPVSELTDDSGDFNNDFPGYNWQFTVEDAPLEALGSLGERFKQLDLTITRPDQNLTFHLRTYRFLMR